jgi:hypothetical protein
MRVKINNTLLVIDSKRKWRSGRASLKTISYCFVWVYLNAGHYSPINAPRIKNYKFAADETQKIPGYKTMVFFRQSKRFHRNPTGAIDHLYIRTPPPQLLCDKMRRLSQRFFHLRLVARASPRGLAPQSIYSGNSPCVMPAHYRRDFSQPPTNRLKPALLSQ